MSLCCRRASRVLGPFLPSFAQPWPPRIPFPSTLKTWKCYLIGYIKPQLPCGPSRDQWGSPLAISRKWLWENTHSSSESQGWTPGGVVLKRAMLPDGPATQTQHVHTSRVTHTSSRKPFWIVQPYPWAPEKTTPNESFHVQ